MYITFSISVRYLHQDSNPNLISILIATDQLFRFGKRSFPQTVGQPRLVSPQILWSLDLMQYFRWILHLKKRKGKLILLTGGPASIVWWTSTSIGRRAVLRQDDFTFLKLFLGTSEYWNKMHKNLTAYLTEKSSHLFFVLKKRAELPKIE